MSSGQPAHLKRWRDGYGFELMRRATAWREAGVPIYVDQEGYTRIGQPPVYDDEEPRESVHTILARQFEDDLAAASRLGCDYFTLLTYRLNSPPEWYAGIRKALIRQQEKNSKE